MRDLMGLMKQAQGLQQKFADMQAEFDTLEVTGTAGGGAVNVIATAKGLVKSVSIDPSLMVPDDKEILEDLMVAAVNDARGKAERLMQEKMGDLTKGLPLPPGMKLPF
jgi:DNA-binding YbaB/EbfC family protein